MAEVVLDTNVVIALLSPTDALHQAARAAVQRCEREGARFAMSAISWAELLTGAWRRGADAVKVVERFVAATIDELVAVDEDVAACAADLRAKDLALRLPDAIVLSTGLRARSGRVLTADRRLARHARELVEVIG